MDSYMVDDKAKGTYKYHKNEHYPRKYRTFS